MTIFFLTLLTISVCAFFAGLDSGGFKYAQTHYYPYFQGWISLANLIFCLALAIAAHKIHKKQGLEPLRYVPLALIFFAIAIALIGIHVSYCKNCGDVGFCGTAHDYPNAVSILGICISLVLYLSSIKEVDSFAHALSILYHSLMIGFAAIIVVLFISIFYMKFPEPSPYAFLQRPNVQGITFICISLFSFLAFLDLFHAFKTTGKRVFVHIGIQFIVIALVQLVAFYHIATCYGCAMGECSEFFTLAGIFILIAVYLLWYSYSALKKGTKPWQIDQWSHEASGRLGNDDKGFVTKENLVRLPNHLLPTNTVSLHIFYSVNMAPPEPAPGNRPRK